MGSDQQLCAHGLNASMLNTLRGAGICQGDTSSAGISCPCARLGSASLKRGCVRRGLVGAGELALTWPVVGHMGEEKKCGGDDCAAFIETQSQRSGNAAKTYSVC